MARLSTYVRNAITGQIFTIVDDDNKTFRNACKSEISLDQEWRIYDQDGNDISNVKLKDFHGTPHLGPKRTRIKLKVRNVYNGEYFNVVDDDNKTFREACESHASMNEAWGVYDRDGNNISDAKLKGFRGTAYIGLVKNKNLIVRNAITGEIINIVDDEKKTFWDACKSQVSLDQEWRIYDRDGNDISNVKLKDFSGTPYLSPKRTRIKLDVWNAYNGEHLNVVEDDNKTFREACNSRAPLNEAWIVYDRDGNDISNAKLKDFRGTAFIGQVKTIDIIVRNAITGLSFHVINNDNKTFRDACGSHAPMDQDWRVYDQDDNDISNVKLKDFHGTAYIGLVKNKNLRVRNAITGEIINIVDDEKKTLQDACKSQVSLDQEWRIYDQDGNDISNVKLRDFHGTPYLGPIRN